MKRIIILIGPPGAGKGTQAGLLAERFNLYHWETSHIIGKMIEEAKKGQFVKVEGRKYYFEEEKRLSESGKLWDPPFLVYSVKKKFHELAREDKGIVLVGSPRTLYEGEKIVPLLKKLYRIKNILVVRIRLSAKESLWRNSHRRECELMRHPILYTKETAKLSRCPIDGSKLILRVDDKPEIIKRRLREYRQRTFPLIKLFEKKGLTIKSVNGSRPPAEVFKNILKAVKSFYGL